VRIFEYVYMYTFTVSSFKLPAIFDLFNIIIYLGSNNSAGFAS
jgi:hypothetical protein